MKEFTSFSTTPYESRLIHQSQDGAIRELLSDINIFAKAISIIVLVANYPLVINLTDVIGHFLLANNTHFHHGQYQSSWSINDITWCDRARRTNEWPIFIMVNISHHGQPDVIWHIVLKNDTNFRHGQYQSSGAINDITWHDRAQRTREWHSF